MKKLALGIGLLALCGGMMACSNEDCEKDYTDCVAACTGEDKTTCEQACLNDKLDCEDQTCTTPLIINEISRLKGTVNYADVGTENCIAIATNVTTYLATNTDALKAAFTDWSDYEKGNVACKTLNGALTLLALIDLYTIYNSIETCQTTFAGSGYEDDLAKVNAAIQGLNSVEGITAALQAGADAAASNAGK